MLLVASEMAPALQIALTEAGLDAYSENARARLGGAADADLIVCEPDTLPAAAEVAEARQGRGAQEPLLVLLGAAESKRKKFLESGVDLVICGEFDAVTVALQLAAVVRRFRIERDRNPLTGLPGNRWLQSRLRRRLAEGRTIGLLLLDIDRFKLFNDRYGHLMGDAAIEMLAESVLAATASEPGATVTHPGGDDFCVLAAPETLESIARAVFGEFQRRSAGLCAEESEHPPTLSAVATTVHGTDADIAATFGRLATLKNDAKLKAGNTYLCDDERALQ